MVSGCGLYPEQEWVKSLSCSSFVMPVRLVCFVIVSVCGVQQPNDNISL